MNKVCRSIGPQQLVYGRRKHLYAGLYDYDRYQRTQVTVQRYVPDKHYSGRYQRSQCNYCVKQSIGPGCGQGIALQLPSLAPYIESQDQFGYDCHNDDNQRNGGIIGLNGIDDLAYGLYHRCDTGGKHDGRNDYGAEILHTSVTERMGVVGRLERQLGAGDGYHAGQCVAEVVYCIEHDGNRTCQNAHKCLECSQEHIGNYPYYACTYNLLGSIHKMVLYFSAKIQIIVILECTFQYVWHATDQKSGNPGGVNAGSLGCKSLKRTLDVALAGYC